METPENPLFGKKDRRGTYFCFSVFVQATKNGKTCQDPLQGQNPKKYG
jgi:hypothetical protein